ncbi:MAG: hypothetical protein R3F61_34050 [Myxococcota bacterium]
MGILLFPIHVVAALLIGTGAVVALFDGGDVSDGCGCFSSVSLMAAVVWLLLFSCCCCGVLPDCGGSPRSQTTPAEVMEASPRAP